MKKTYKPSEDELSAMLTISQRLLFDEVHEHAVEELSKRIDTIDPVKQLVLVKEHSIDDWRIPAYAKLVERPDRLTLEEAKKLSLEDILVVTACRELYYHRDNWKVEIAPTNRLNSGHILAMSQGPQPPPSASQQLAKAKSSASSIIRREFG